MKDLHCLRVIRVIHVKGRDLEVMCSGAIIQNVCKIEDSRGKRVLLEFRCTFCGDFYHTVLSGVAVIPFFPEESVK